MTDWALVVGVLALLGTALGAVWVVGQTTGSMKERVRSLEARTAQAEARLEAMRDQLARGDTSFAEVRGELRAVTATLVEIKEDIEKLLPKG